jgi:hypothetical protein
MAYKSVNGKLVKMDSSKPNIRKGNGFKLPTHKVGSMTFGSLDYMTEFQKAANMVLSDPPTYDVKSTPVDYNAMGFSNAGFLMALVPVKKQPNGLGFLAKGKTPEDLKQVLSGFSIQQIADEWVLLKTYITSDIAYKAFNELHGVLHTAFIAYSTPENISTLSEDKDFILAYRDNKDVTTVLEMMS